VEWYNFMARIQPIFSGGPQGFDRKDFADMARIFIDSW
jgi:hypothetical protein